MNKLLIVLSLCSLSNFSYGERMKANIQEIEYGKKGQDHLIKLSNGRVVFSRDRDGFLSRKQTLIGETVEVEVDRNSTLKSIASYPSEELPIQDEAISFDEFTEKRAVISEAEAQRIFSGMNRSWKSNTECTDRAQIWAYEEFKKNNLISKKVFLFFTNTYIRKYRYHWWFHVSPYVDTPSAEKVMDRRYTSGPRNMKTWTDIFIRSKRSCPVNTYRYFRANKNGPEHCVLVKTAMYYRLPYHVRMLEDSGRTKSSFSTSEINFSYRAFKRRGI